MSLSLSTPIMGYRDTDIDEILDRMDRPDEQDRDALEAIQKWARVAGVDEAVPFAQFLVETGNGTSIRYTRDKALAGVGIVADDTKQPFKLASVDESARLFIQCLQSLVTRKRHPDIPLSGDVEEWFESVWLPKVRSSAMPTVTKVADLGLRYIENGDSRATWSWERGTGSMDAYGLKLVSRLKQFYPNLPDPGDPPVDTPSTPEEPITATWRQQLDTMFGAGKWSITQGWAVNSGAADYSYGAGHGLNGHQHTGLDVGIPYGTKMYAPADATVVCGGTGVGQGAHGLSCDAFNDWGDGDGSGSKKGVGRIELLFPSGESLIYGHSRTATVRPGDKVTRGQLIGTSGGMNGAHSHLEARTFEGGDYHLIDPKQLLASLPITTAPVEPGEQETPTVALPIRQMIIPAGNRNRPGSKLNDADLYIWIHDTGNPGIGADAQMHAIFVRNGGGNESVSFHGTVDDTEFIQLLPADEVGWHAGDSCDSRTNDIGCFQSFAIETCVNVDGNWNQTKENLIDACVAIIKGDSRIDFAGRKGRFSPSRIRQHNASSGKDCPHKIRAEGSWGYITGQVTSRAAGTPTEPTTPPPSEEFFAGLDLAVTKRLFGSVKGEDGVTYKFDKNGPVSKLWFATGEATGQWPTLAEIWVYGDGRRYFRFEDGSTIFDPPGESAKPQWLKKEAA